MSGMRRVRLSAAMCLAFCSAALMSACSNAIDLGGRNDGGQGSDAAVGCTCAPSEACLEVTIERSADPALWTWVQFREPGVDGAGRLVMGLFDSGFRVVQRTAVPDVNLAESARINLTLGCVAPGSYQLTAFLDDNNNADPMSIQSADYRDSCGPGALRTPSQVNLTAGMTTQATRTIGQSCD